MIENGYNRIGLVPLSVRKILQTCKAPVSEENIQNIESKIPALINVFKEYGQITEEELSEHSIIRSVHSASNELVKNEGYISRQRAVMLTHERTVARHNISQIVTSATCTEVASTFNMSS